MDLLKKIFIFILILNSFIIKANAQYRHSEKSYQYAWCAQNNGIAEYINQDKTRIDCLTHKIRPSLIFSLYWQVFYVSWEETHTKLEISMHEQ